MKKIINLKELSQAPICMYKKVFPSERRGEKKSIPFLWMDCQELGVQRQGRENRGLSKDTVGSPQGMVGWSQHTQAHSPPPVLNLCPDHFWKWVSVGK